MESRRRSRRVATTRVRTTARPQARARNFLNNELNNAQLREFERIIKMIRDGRPLQEIDARWKRFVEAELVPYATSAQVSSGEISAAISELLQLNLQNIVQKQQQALQMFSTILKALHDTAMALIRNLR